MKVFARSIRVNGLTDQVAALDLDASQRNRVGVNVNCSEARATIRFALDAEVPETVRLQDFTSVIAQTIRKLNPTATSSPTMC